MGAFHDGSLAAQPYKDPTPLPDDIPKVQELGATSAPLKSAAFFIGAHCKDFSGVFLHADIV
jgi:NADH dehydrogenase (ubiquinone) 1 alpha subcomplex subunit 8